MDFKRLAGMTAIYLSTLLPISSLNALEPNYEKVSVTSKQSFVEEQAALIGSSTIDSLIQRYNHRHEQFNETYELIIGEVYRTSADGEVSRWYDGGKVIGEVVFLEGESFSINLDFPWYLEWFTKLNDSEYIYKKLSEKVYIEKKISDKPEELMSIIENGVLSAFSYSADYHRFEKDSLLNIPFKSNEMDLVSLIDTALHNKLGDTTETCILWNDYTITKDIISEAVGGDSTEQLWNLGIIWGTMNDGEFKKVKKGGETVSFKHPTLTIMKEVSDRVFPLAGGTVLSLNGGVEIQIYGRIKEIL